MEPGLALFFTPRRTTVKIEDEVGEVLVGVILEPSKEVLLEGADMLSVRLKPDPCERMSNPKRLLVSRRFIQAGHLENHHSCGQINRNPLILRGGNFKYRG